MENKLELATQYGSNVSIQIEISHYLKNGCLYVGLTSDGVMYGDLTVNLREGAPPYCGYIDTNNMPEVVQFITQNDLGHFTGLIQQSGYCAYPLYSFNVERLRELCPGGMAEYEAVLQAKKVHMAEKGKSR